MSGSASLITYSTEKEKFDSMYERNQFYRGLFGYKQTVKKNGKTYEYDKDGLMDRVPNIRIDDSVFIVNIEKYPEVKEFFETWSEKISYHVFEVILEDREILQQIEKAEEQSE